MRSRLTVGAILLIGLSTSPLLHSTTAGVENPTSPPPSPPAAHCQKKSDGKSVKTSKDDLDEYSNTATIADPIEPLNRVTFWINHQLYRYVLKPISKSYDAVIPKPIRTGVYNVFENLEFPIRFVNDTLQFQFKRAGLETEKFVVNSTVGVGGLVRVSDHIPALAEVPPSDTAQTFANWGVGHGIYIVLPALGPRSLRDTVGLVGDYALYPVTWVTLGVLGGLSGASTYAVSTPDTVRSVHNKLNTYDTVTRNTIDRYLAVRTAYIQNRLKKNAQ